MMATTKELVEALTKTLKNINQSPTIPLPVFKGKKREDPEDHILKVEDYFGTIKLLNKMIRPEDSKILFSRQQENGHKLWIIQKLSNLTMTQKKKMTRRLQ